MKYLIIE